MKRLLSLLVALLLCLPHAVLAANYCDCPDAQTHAERQEAFERILREYDTMGASIAIFKGGRIVDTFQYGRAHRADNVPVDSETVFRVASVSKMVSAVGVLRLVEEGLLTLDGDISDVLCVNVRNPYYAKTPITLRQIMTHTASLSDEYHYKKATRGEIVSLEHVFDGNYTQMNYQRREPGTHVAYSNFGGGLLGSIIEMESAMTIDEYMQHYVFGPLGITAGYHMANMPGAYVARVYNTESTGMTLDVMSMDEEHFDADPFYNYVHSAGALCITAEGLAKICIALAGDGSVDGVQLLSPDTVAQMRTRQDNIGSVTCDSERGLNLNIIENRLASGRTLYGHQGKAYGMICAAYFDPTDQTGVVLLTNGCNTGTVDTVARIARAVIAKGYEYLDAM